MPKPLTMYKGDEVAYNIYPSERAAWEGQGWSDSPNVQKEQSEPEKVSSESSLYTQSELEEMHWTDIKEVAEALGLNKGDDQAWKDLIPEILEKSGAD